MTSTTFKRPPLDGSLSITALYDWHYANNRDYPLFVFEDQPGSLRTISMGEGVQGIHRASSHIFGVVGAAEEMQASSTVAILSASDSISLFCTILGTIRTGCTAFPLSPRESPEAIAYLLSEGKADYVIVSPEAALQKLAEAAISLMDEQKRPKKADTPSFTQLFPNVGFDPDFPFVPSAKQDMEGVAAIYHSSGTTSFPKPVFWAHKAYIGIASIPTFGATSLTGKITSNHCVPIFHGMGLIPLTFPATVGMIVSVFKPQAPAIMPNPTNVFDGMVSTKSEFVLVPPVFIESWSQNPAYVDVMASMEGVIYGGGPLDKDAGDVLASRGVNVYVTYACVQTALLSEVLPEPAGMDWEYFRMSPGRAIHLRDFGDNMFEVIVPVVEGYRPNIINTESEGIEAYATSDLVSPHPTKKGYFKVVGRTDDQIVHSTSEKTNPGPLESILAQDPLIQSAVMFGRGRFQCGVIIQPSQGNVFDPSDTQKPTVEKANARAATHSRIFLEMILIASPSKPFEYTSKGNLRRQRILDAYATEINALYDLVSESTQEDVDGPSEWNPEDAKVFVKNVVTRTLRTRSTDVGDDEDLFENGLDSLQATWIRNTVLRVLRNSDPKFANRLSTNFVYECPTVNSMVTYLVNITSGKLELNGYSLDAKKEELRAMVDKYSQSFPVFAPQGMTKTEISVLLTGATGAFGSNILAALLSDNAISQVHVLSRPSANSSVSDKLAGSFKREGLDGELLLSSKLECHAGDPSNDGFGLPVEEYASLQGSVTHIIHNGWRVDFNLSLLSFQSNVMSVRNLAEFALGGRGLVPARLLFVSSIGIFQNYDGAGAAPETFMDSPDSCIGTGYVESKWVSEQILKAAMNVAAEEPLKSTVVRPGQMTGGPSGAWNTMEWFPSLIKSSLRIGKLPTVQGNVSWLNSTVAASALLDMMLHDDNEPVLHLVHPQPVPWISVISAFADELKLPTVPYDEWLDALRNSGQALDSVSHAQPHIERTLQQNPALRLLKFFEAAKGKISADVEPLGIPRLANEKAQRVSESLRSAPQVDGEDVKRWVAYWRSTGFISEELSKGVKRSIDQLS